MQLMRGSTRASKTSLLAIAHAFFLSEKKNVPTVWRHRVDCPWFRCVYRENGQLLEISKLFNIFKNYLFREKIIRENLNNVKFFRRSTDGRTAREWVTMTCWTRTRSTVSWLTRRATMCPCWSGGCCRRKRILNSCKVCYYVFESMKWFGNLTISR